MPRKKTLFINPFLNAYVYDVLYNVSSEQRKLASKATQKILSTSARAKSFSANSTEDEKKKVLSELGYQWSTIITPSGINSASELKKMMLNVEQGRTAAGVSHLIKEKIFITTDKQLSFLLGLAAQTIAHSNYFMNLDLIKNGHALKKWSKRITKEEDAITLEAVEYADIIDKLVNNIVETYPYVQGLLGITEKEFLILQYLSRNRHLYIGYDRVSDNFKGIITGVGVTSNLKKLLSANYIRKHIQIRPVRYTITASGIELVARFRNRVLNTIN
mgnify:FL=1